MIKRYVIFIDEEQLRIVLTEVQVALAEAIRTQRAELIVPLAGLVNQLKHPREVREKNRGWVAVLKDQVFGK